MKRLNPLAQNFFRDNIFNLLMAVLGTTVLSVAILCVPQLIQLLIDFLANKNDYSIWRILLLAAGILVMELFAGICTYFFRTRFSAKAVAEYRKYAYNYLMQKNVSDFYGNNSAMYMSAMTNDIVKIKECLLDQIPIISQVIICGIGSILIMIKYDFLLAIISCLISMIPFCAAIISGKKMPEAEDRLSSKNADYLAFLKDFSIGFTIIKSYKCEEAFSGLHIKSADEVESAMLTREKVFEKVNYFAAMSGYITQFSVLFACALVAYVKGTISVGTVIAFSQLIKYIIDPVTELPSMLMEAKTAYALSDKFWNNIKISNDKVYGSHTDIVFDGNIDIENVNFSYDIDKNILNNISIHIERREKVALIGASGSGKSTILKLITGMLRPETGKIKLSGYDVTQLDETAVFEQISYIQQEVFVFDGSIYDNITLFRKYDDSDVEQAIEKAGLKKLVDEKGLDYHCGENGSALSGGERQRINIARSLLRRTKLLLADEITAALDNETGYKVMNSLIDINDITEVIVLHDLDSRILNKIDKIFALKDGKIVEEGTFSDLIKKKGYFYSLYSIDNS